MKSVLAIGPYIGNFEEELLTFRPYANWLLNVIEHEKAYLSTHLNRVFLYEQLIDKDNIIPINESLSRDEINQVGYIHKKLQQKEFNTLVKIFKEKITKKESCSKRDIDLYHLNYIKSTPPYSIYNKVFDKIKQSDIIIPIDHEERILFIPSKNDNPERLLSIYNYLSKNYDCLIIGNNDTWFDEYNVIVSNIDYFENGLKYIIEYISKAKAVICPISYWTSLCNLQQKPVFSWGTNPGQYRKGGIYYFGNKKSVVVPSDKETDIEVIIKSIGHFLGEL